MIDISYADPAIEYLGRWIDDGSGIYSAWQGSQARFDIDNSFKFRVDVDIVDENEEDLVGVVANIDGGPPQAITISSAAEKTNGRRSVIFYLPDSSKHNVVLKLYGSPESQWSGKLKNKLVSISVEEGGSLPRSDRNQPMRIGFIGDSWMATTNDWPRLLDPGKYSAWPVSFGGATMKELNAQYEYESSSAPLAREPELDLVLVGSGVNDFNARKSVWTYGASAFSLVQKIKKAHPESRVVLLQAPSNTKADMNYGKYGWVLSLVAWLNGVYYLEFPEEKLPLLEWKDDNRHLTFDSLKLYASIIGNELEKITN